MPNLDQSSGGIEALLDSVRDPEVKPNWGLSLQLVVLLASGVAIAAVLGDPGRAVFTIFPFLVAVVGGLAAGWRTGLALSLLTVGLITAAGLFAFSPLTAALGFGAIALWCSVPSRWRPSPRVGPILLLIYFIAMASAQPDPSLGISVVFALAALVIGMLVMLLITKLRDRRRSTHAPPTTAAPQDETTTPPREGATLEVQPSPPKWRVWIGPVLAAAVIAALTYWHSVTPDFQMPLWVLLTFLVVYHPTHPATLKRSLLRMAGTITGFVAVLILGLLPATLAHALGAASVVPAIAYAKRSYLLSVAALTVMVVTFYGAPTGEYLTWGLARTVDTAIGAAVAIALSALVRRIQPVPEDPLEQSE